MRHGEQRPYADGGAMLKESTADDHVFVGLRTVKKKKHEPRHLLTSCRRIQLLAVAFEYGKVLNESNQCVFRTACATCVRCPGLNANCDC